MLEWVKWKYHKEYDRKRNKTNPSTKHILRSVEIR